jgi:hypothetical protein
MIFSYFGNLLIYFFVGCENAAPIYEEFGSKTLLIHFCVFEKNAVKDLKFTGKCIRMV